MAPGVWESWIAIPQIQQLEKELIKRGLTVVKMNDYVRFSNSTRKLYSVAEFKAFADEVAQHVDSPAPPVTASRQRGPVPTNIDAHDAVRTSQVTQVRPEPHDLKAVLAELDGLIGLDGAKSQVRSLINSMSNRNQRMEKGLRPVDRSLHMIFGGNPGTGKTTVARLIASIYAHIGILRKGHLVEVDRSGLVAGFVGQTAIKTADVIGRSLDGVLFIDEAYSLADKGSHDFGSEAIETLLKAMEDNRDRLIVIVAGYSSKMSEFIRSNPGLKSRFSRTIEFQDYSPTELLLIADHMAQQYSFLFEPDAHEALGHILTECSSQDQTQFGNARGVRNLFEAIIDAQANRLANFSMPSREDLQTIKLNDVMLAVN